VCLICVTAKNVRAPWLYYEAGAIAFALNDPYVCPYLIDTGTDAIANTPFGQLQVTRFDREDTFRLLKSINARLPTPHDESLLRATFDKKWPSLKKKIDKLIADQPKDSPPPPAAPPAPSLLSDEAARILVAATGGKEHKVYVNDSAHGQNVSAGDTSFLENSHDDRKNATYLAAVGELVNRGFIEDKWGKGQVYAVTKPGYTASDEAKKLLPPELSDEAKTILLAASAEKDGQVMGNQDFEGYHLSAGGTQVCRSDDDHVVAGFHEALEDLVNRGFLRIDGDEKWQITRAGYTAAKALTPKPAAPASPLITDEADILVHLQGWMHKKFHAGTRTPPISFTEVDSELNLAPGSAAKLLERAAAKLNWTPDSQGPTVIVFKRVGAPGSAPRVINRS
jgi:hypothetical protein